VYNVTKRAVGVVVNKRIKNRYIAKKINVRVEHISHSNSRKEFLERAAENDRRKVEASKAGIRGITEELKRKVSVLEGSCGYAGFGQYPCS